MDNGLTSVPYGNSFMNPINAAAKMGSCDPIVLLTRTGTDIHTLDEYGRSPLLHTVENQDTNLYRHLLKPD